MPPDGATPPVVPSPRSDTQSVNQSTPTLNRNDSPDVQRHGRTGAAPLSQILNPAADPDPVSERSRFTLPEPWMVTSPFDRDRSNRERVTPESSFRHHDSPRVLDFLTPQSRWSHSSGSEDTFHVASILTSMSQGSSSQTPDDSAGIGAKIGHDTSALESTISVKPPSLQEQFKASKLLAPKTRTKLPDKTMDDGESSTSTSSSVREIHHNEYKSPRVPKIYSGPSPDLDARKHVILGYFPQVDAPPNKVSPPPPPALDSEGRLVSRETRKGSSSSSVTTTSTTSTTTTTSTTEETSPREAPRSPSWNYLIYGMLARSPTQEMTLSELFHSIIAWCPGKTHRTHPNDDGSLRHALTTCSKFVNILPRVDTTTGKQTDGGRGLWRIRWVDETGNANKASSSSSSSSSVKRTTPIDEAAKEDMGKTPFGKKVQKRERSDELEGNGNRSSHSRQRQGLGKGKGKSP
ncbi:hypothetical protein B7463_g2613, partial [Scytalidium lignicola]